MLVVVLLLVVCFIDSNDAREKKNCLLFRHKCVDHCPPTMHPYHTRCDVDTVSQRTCRHPTPYVLGFTCGWSRCDCNGDLLLTDGDICVPQEKCYISRKPVKKHKPHPKYKYYKFRAEGELPEIPVEQGSLVKDLYENDPGTGGEFPNNPENEDLPDNQR